MRDRKEEKGVESKNRNGEKEIIKERRKDRRQETGTERKRNGTKERERKKKRK